MVYIYHLTLDWNSTDEDGNIDESHGFHEIYLICKDEKQFHELKDDYFDGIYLDLLKYGIDGEMPQYFEYKTVDNIPLNKNIIDATNL